MKIASLEEELYKKEKEKPIDPRKLSIPDFFPFTGTPSYFARNLSNRGPKFYLNLGVIRLFQFGISGILAKGLYSIIAKAF